MVPLLLAVALSAGAAGPTTLFDLPPGLTEVSGMAYGASGTLWVHEDSGSAATITGLTAAGGVRTTYDLGVQARDWEDMAAGPGGTLLVADIGDNRGVRTLGVLVHRFAEPRGSARPAPESIRLNYEDRPQDAEALLVHPRTGQALVVTKGVLGQGVYAAPQPLRKGLLRKVGDVRTQGTGTPGGPVVGAVSQRLVTAGAVSPDGRRVALRTYTDAYVYEVPGDDLVEALDGEPTVIALPESTQGEAMTWSPDGRSLVVTGEGEGAAVSRVPVVAAPARAPQAPGAEQDRVPLVLAGAGAAGVLVLLLGLARRRGRASRRRHHG